MVTDLVFDKVEMIYKEAGRFDAPEYQGLIHYYFSEDKTGKGMRLIRNDPGVIQMTPAKEILLLRR